MSLVKCSGSHSYAKSSSIVHLWRIDNVQSYFLTPNVENQLLNSQKFSTDDGCDWCVVLYPKGDLPDNREHLSAFLRLESRLRIHARFTLSLLDAEGRQLCCFKHNLPYRFRPPEYSILGWSKFYPIKDLNSDTIYLRCCVQTLSRRTDVQTYQIPACKTGDTMADNVAVFFDNSRFSDVVVVAGETSCYAHKVVLAARSSVFSAMFAHEMSENRTNEVVVNDCDPEVVYEFLRYLYTDSVAQDVLEKHSEALLALADQYDVENLKLKCEDLLLSSTIDLDNVIDLYTVADRHRSSRLKKKSISFIRQQMRSLVKHASWEKVRQQRPDLIADITTAVFNEDDAKDSHLSASELTALFNPFL